MSLQVKILLSLRRQGKIKLLIHVRCSCVCYLCYSMKMSNNKKNKANTFNLHGPKTSHLLHSLRLIL